MMAQDDEIKLAEWWIAVPAFVAGGYHERKKMLKCFRAFCEERGFGAVDEGFDVARALEECVRAWDAASEEERATVVDFESLRELRLKYRHHKMDYDHEAEKRASDRYRAVRETHKRKRVWRLGGLFIDEQSLDLYTLIEIEAWLDWSAYNFRHDNPDVKIMGDIDGEEYWIDVSLRFANPCNDPCRTPSFEELAKDLRDYTNDRRQQASAGN